MPSSSFTLESPKVAQAQLATLMQNILDDDVINLEARCPTNPEPDFTAAELEECYRLAWQLLVTGVDISATRALIASIALRGGATAEQTINFKFMRARFKKMRFACANYSEAHAYPARLDSITKLMGRFQDAFKNGQKRRTCWLGIKLWWRLEKGFFSELHETLVQAKLTSVESFHRFIAAENQELAKAAEVQSSVTARQFHDMRKIISRRIALSDTRRAVTPSADYDAVSLFLATLNGLMGRMHDDLVVVKIRNKLDYETELFQLPDEIASRIRSLVITQKGL
jgi:hypothetical protein